MSIVVPTKLVVNALTLTIPLPLFGLSVMFPVLLPPRVRDCLLVVPSIPSPVR